MAQNLEILKKLISLGGSTFLLGYIERKNIKKKKKHFKIVQNFFKILFFIFMWPKWKMDPPREVNFFKISKFWAILSFMMGETLLDLLTISLRINFMLWLNYTYLKLEDICQIN